MTGTTRNRLLRFGAIVLAATIAAGTAFVAMRYAYQAAGDVPRMAGRLHAELEAAQREGLPLTAADPRRRPSLPPGQNAARFPAKVPGALGSAGPGVDGAATDVLHAIYETGLTAAARRKARDVLQRTSAALKLAEQAGRMPHCDFERNWDLGPELLFPEYAAARRIAQLLVIRAMLNADAGRPEQAFADIRLGATLAQHIGEEPCLIALLVRIAIEAIMARAWERVLMDHIGDVRFVRAARESRDTWGPLPDLGYYVRGELVMARACMNIVRRGGTASRVTGEPEDAAMRRRLRDTWVRRMLCDAWETRIVAYYRKLFAIARSRRNDSTAVQHALERLEREADAEAREHRVSTVLLELVRPVWAQAADKIRELEARRALREALLRVSEYRVRTHRLPDTASDLGRPLPTDPYSGQRVLLRRAGDALILYSVGWNERDDGGEPPPASARGAPPDITLVYPPSAAHR